MSSPDAHGGIPDPASKGPPDPARFTFRIGRKSVPLLWLFGVRPDRAWVVVDDEMIDSRFGWFELAVPLADIERWRIEGPWHWITAIGVRMSIRHRDLSFAGSPRGGVRLDFRERIRWGPLRVPALYLGVEDLEGLAAELDRRGIRGEDARTSR